MEISSSASNSRRHSTNTMKLNIDIAKLDYSLRLCNNLSQIHQTNVYPLKLKSKISLRKENYGPELLNLQIDTSGFTNEFKYNPGDVIALYPANRKELVNAILTRVISSSNDNQIISKRFPVCSLRYALTNYLDITSPLTQHVLSLFLLDNNLTPQDKCELEKLVLDDVWYSEWKEKKLNLVEILNDFQSLKLNANLLVENLPILKARLYSISSSPISSPNSIHITVKVIVQFPNDKHDERQVHFGVCSKWLDDLDIKSIIPASFNKSQVFHLPENREVPIVMIGIGSGISSFRSFWQHRKAEKKLNLNNHGEMVFYYGCHRSRLDELYRDEIDSMIKNNIITHYYVAYSREPYIKKVNFEQFYDLIFNKNGEIYICGDVKLTNGVVNSIRLGLMKYKQVSNQIHLNQLIANLKIHENKFKKD